MVLLSLLFKDLFCHYFFINLFFPNLLYFKVSKLKLLYYLQLFLLLYRFLLSFSCMKINQKLILCYHFQNSKVSFFLPDRIHKLVLHHFNSSIIFYLSLKIFHSFLLISQKFVRLQKRISDSEMEFLLGFLEQGQEDQIKQSFYFLQVYFGLLFSCRASLRILCLILEVFAFNLKFYCFVFEIVRYSRVAGCQTIISLFLASACFECFFGLTSSIFIKIFILFSSYFYCFELEIYKN